MSASAAPAALTVSGLDVDRGEATVLRGVAFDVELHGVTAILGRNGAGKTTTLLGLLGLLESSGSIELDSEDISGLPVHERVQRGIGYVPEDREVFSDLTVDENMTLAIRGRPDAGRLALVRDLFPILVERSGQLAGSLSGGQQQMVAIARALVNDNKLLLVDEPSKGLAPAVVTDMVEAMKRVKGDTTMLLVEQNLSVANALADHVVILDQGRVVHAGSMDEVRQKPEIAHRWLGVEFSAQRDGGL